MKVLVRDTTQSNNNQEAKEDNFGQANPELLSQLQASKRQSIKNSTLKLFSKNADSAKGVNSTKGNIEQNNSASGLGGLIANQSQNAGSNNGSFQPSKTVSIMNKLFQKQSNVRPSKVNFDDKTQVNFIQKQTSLKRFDYTPEQIIQDPLVNVFPDGMPRKHILYKELLQAYFNGDISMNELIDLRNKYTMRKQKNVSVPLKDEEDSQEFNDKKDQKANARLWQQIRNLRQKQMNKIKNNEIRAKRGSILMTLNTPTGGGLMRRDSLQSVLQSQNSFSQTTLTRVDTKVDFMMQQIDEKDENNKIEEEPTSSTHIQSHSAPNPPPAAVAGQPKKITKFGSIIFDKLLNIKDKVEHKKVLEMKQNKQNQNQFLTQFEEAQQEVIEKIKRGDLLQNDLSHKYYVKQFIERKNLNHLKILADKTAQIESLVSSKTVKRMNEDFKANKHKIFKEIEEAADEYLNKIQLKKHLLEKYSHNNTDKYDELEKLKHWRQQNSKKILKEQKEKHMNQYQFEKEQKELEQEQKKQRIIRSRMVRNSMDSISYIQSKQENSTSVENIRNSYYNSAQRYPVSNSANNNQYQNSLNQQSSIIGQILKKEKSSPSIITQSKNLAQLQAMGNGAQGLYNSRQTLTMGNNNTNNFNQTATTSSVLHVSRTSMTDYTPILGPSNRKTSQYLNNLSNLKSSKLSSADLLQRKTTDGQMYSNKNNQNQGQQKYVEDYLNLNGTASSTATTSNSNKLSSLFLPQKVKGQHNSSNNSTSIPISGFPKTVDFDLKKNQKQIQMKRNHQQNIDNDSLSKSALVQQNAQEDEEMKENQKKVIQYLSNSKIINEHHKQNKPTVFLKEIYDLYSQEELYRNNPELRMRSKMHVSDKENLSKFYKSEYDYKVIKRNANVSTSDRQNSLSKIDADRSLSTLPNYDYKQNRVKSESNCLTGLGSNSSKQQQYYNNSNTINVNNTNEDSLIDTNTLNNNNNNNNNLDDSESGDSSLPSITEAQLDSLYSQSRHIQKMILKSKGNTQLFARRMKNVIKLKEINEGINKCIKMKLNHKSINS